MKRFKPYIYFFPLLLILTTFSVHSVLSPVKEVIPEFKIPEAYAPLDAVLLLTLTFFSGLFLLFVFKRSVFFLKLILSSFSLYIVFFTAVFYWEAMSIKFEFLNSLSSIYIGILATAVAAVAILMKLDILYSPLLFTTMIGVGCILNFSMVVSTKIALMIVYSIFDLYSVYRGALGKMLGSSGNPKSKAIDLFFPLLVKINGLSVGSGDVVFYSMASSLSIDLGIAPFIAVSTALFIGFLIDLWLLKKKRVVPGLPIPIILSLIAIVIWEFTYF